MRSLLGLSLITSVSALLFASIAQLAVFEIIICASLFVLVCLASKDQNSQLLTLIFAFIFILEVLLALSLKYVIFPSVESYFFENIYAFGLQLCINLLLLILLKYRMKVAVMLTKGKSASVFEKNHAEGPLYFLVIVLVIVDFLALMENFVRNLDRLGVNREVAKAYWDFTFFYDYFEYLKAVPTLLCVVLLYVGLIARKKSKDYYPQL